MLASSDLVPVNNENHKLADEHEELMTTWKANYRNHVQNRNSFSY